MGTQTKKTTKIAVPVKGSPVKDASGKVVGTAQFNPNTGKPLKDPVITSDRVRSENNALGVDIRGLKNAYAADNAQIQAQQAALAERRANEIAGIKTEFDIAKGAQEVGQERDFGARATSLITSGGGFLGGTQSQQGVLQNLRGTHETEKTALMAKREAAILAANTAYEDKDFALARELSKNAKEIQNEIYRRQKDYADQTLALTRENRAQTEFDMGIADKKIQSYSLMSDEDFANIDPATIADMDSVYGSPGYTKRLRDVNKKALDIKNTDDEVSLQIKIQNLVNDTPAGKKFTINGKTYAGLKTSGSGSTAGQITPTKAFQLGIPSLAGKKESEVVESLNYNNPPLWYYEFYKTSAPEIFTQLTPAQLLEDWKLFKAQPDIEAYRNSAVVSGRIQGEDPNADLNAARKALGLPPVQ